MTRTKQLNKSLILSSLALGAGLSACTGQIPGSIRLAQQEQTFKSTQEVNTKIDLLWVVDNSSSMDIAQDKLRSGFATFAAKYMQPTWDIRVAVISTDTYLANTAFSPYLNTTIPGTVGVTSTYINSRLATFVNPPSNPTLINTGTGVFTNGFKYKDLMPAWVNGISRLIPGTHDGPMAALCVESLPYFLLGETKCNIRDNQLGNTGTYNCLHPNTGAGESSITQCVNTLENDTIHSGKPIITTMPGSPLSGSALTAWTNKLVDDFMINVSTGTAGHGSERGLGSVLQLLNDNESTSTAFFRPGSLRGIIFITDEEDQTMDIEASPPAGFNPYTHYACDQAGLVALNGAGPITGAGAYCCTGGSCRFGAEGITCPSKTVDGYTYTPSVCPVSAKLTPVANVKAQLDTFFSALDAVAGTGPNYFVVSLVPLSGTSIQALQAARNADDIAAGGFKTVATDRGDRYIALGNLVGNGSMAMELNSTDYTPILNAIGDAIISKKSTFTLARAPTAQEDMIVKVVHADGSETVIPSTKYTISGKSIIITDSAIVLSFSATDKVSINYQPKTAY